MLRLEIKLGKLKPFYEYIFLQFFVNSIIFRITFMKYSQMLSRMNEKKYQDQPFQNIYQLALSILKQFLKNLYNFRKIFNNPLDFFKNLFEIF